MESVAVPAVQSCPTLCDPMDCSLPGFSVHGIFQTRVLEWGAIAQQGQVAQLLGHVWMKLAQDLGPEEPVAGLGASLGAPSPPGRPCPACSHLLPDLQRPLAQRLSLLVLAPLAIQDRQIIQCCSHLEGGERRLCDLGPAGTWELQGAGEEASLTAGWSLPRVFSRMARASLSRWAASLYLFWSLGTGAS